ncbi:hypothetical protein [Vibrio hepatarius]|uniref:hypothetical protein n=1 Tax=Vibrio hepatarius TaxID=171383 RepID=UPI003736CC31
MSFDLGALLGNAVDNVSDSLGGLMGDVVEGVGNFTNDAFDSISDSAMEHLDAAGNVWINDVTNDMQFEKGSNGNVAPDLPASSDHAGNISANSHASVGSSISPGLAIGFATAATITLLAGAYLIGSRGKT